MGKVHLLRPESITPIARYLQRRDQNPDSFAIQLEFAVALLYREREYRATHQVSWFSGTVPAPSAESPFAPYDLTDDAAAILALFLRESQTNAFNESLAQPDDLFGLKSDAADGLGRTLRPIQSHRFGWLVYWRLLTDLGLSRKAAAAARRAAALGEPAPTRPDAFDERIRKSAVRVRTAVEGRGFTRYFTTELAFCQSERKASLKGFDVARVPKALRHLVPLARAVGVGDDPCRALFLRKIPRSDRRAHARKIREAGTAIDAWLATCEGPPFVAEAAAFFWLQEAGEEI